MYGYVPPISWTDPTSATNTDFFVRITVEPYSAAGVSLGEEVPHAGTQITGPGNSHTNGEPFTFDYSVGLDHWKVRVYIANRNSQGLSILGNNEFQDPAPTLCSMRRSMAAGRRVATISR